MAAASLGFSVEDIRQEGVLLDEFSFDPTRKTMSVLYKDTPSRNRATAYVKGAPEVILSLATHIRYEGRTLPFSQERKLETERALQKAATHGYRLIAMGEKGGIIDGKRKESREKIESDLTFVGFMALSDPPREEVREAANLASKAGIKTIIITGDNEQTARAIAHEVGLMKEGDEILTGSALDELTDEQLRRLLPKVRIFARTTPEHKLRIVQAFQQRGEIVAVTGDGVNDALALRQADVGIAMGISGTDVAKEASDIIVTDDNYASIVKAIEEGRIVFDNIVKSVVYLISGNLGELLTILIAVCIGLPTPFFAVQILWINLVTDGLPALALAVDPKDPHVMRRRPIEFSQAILNRQKLFSITAMGFGLALLVLICYSAALIFLNVEKARTIAFTMLILLHIGLALLVRKNHSLFSNTSLNIAILIVFILQMSILFVPALHSVFRIVPLW